MRRDPKRGAKQVSEAGCISGRASSAIWRLHEDA